MTDYFSHNAGPSKPLPDVVDYRVIGITEHIVIWTDETGDHVLTTFEVSE